MKSRLGAGVVAVLALGLLPPAAPGQEVVERFHGYAWGTHRSAIEEIAGSDAVGEKDGLAIYSAPAEVEGYPGLAGFYFHPVTETLVEGAYVLVTTADECDRVWNRLAGAVARSFPELERVDRTASRADAPRDVYDSDCEYFLYNAHHESWRSDFTNPDPPGDKIWMFIRAIERTPRVTVVYRGGLGTEWAERR